MKGYIALISVLIISAVMLLITIGVSYFGISQSKMTIQKNQTLESYYLAQACAEEASMKLKEDLEYQGNETININGNSCTILPVEGSGNENRVVKTSSNAYNQIRKIQIVYKISTEQVSFHYGAQVGDGGMSMGNNSRVKGNIYSNGSVIPAKGGNKGFIDDSIIVAINGNRIEGLQVGKDAKVHTCKDSQITGTLTYVSGGSVQNCTVGGTTITQPNEIPVKDFPIPQSQIDKWKSEAEGGGVISGDYTISGKITQNLGPKKITGNLLVDNNATLNMLGTIWVVGNLRIDNGAMIKLDSNSYGSNSGVIVVDGKIKVRPNTYLRGSGQEGSYLMLLSTNPEVSDTANPAIDVDNNSDAAIFYANQGLIVLKNKINAREVTGYKIFLANNAEILYEAGLEEATFSSGPGGSWEVVSWKEIE